MLFLFDYGAFFLTVYFKNVNRSKIPYLQNNRIERDKICIFLFFYNDSRPDFMVLDFKKYCLYKFLFKKGFVKKKTVFH